jgi:hypothetical protein
VVHKCQVARILTFRLIKASPGAYSAYRTIMCLGLLFYVCVACALHIGFLDDDVIGCMVVPFHI